MYTKDKKKSKRDVEKYVKRAIDKIVDLKKELGESHRDKSNLPDDVGHSDHIVDSVREAVHRGKKIEVKTHYEITIDGEPLGAHFGVSDNGSVHYHGLPNYAFTSMMDLVRKVIDASDVKLPDDQIGVIVEEH